MPGTGADGLREKVVGVLTDHGALMPDVAAAKILDLVAAANPSGGESEVAAAGVDETERWDVFVRAEIGPKHSAESSIWEDAAVAFDRVSADARSVAVASLRDFAGEIEQGLEEGQLGQGQALGNAVGGIAVEPWRLKSALPAAHGVAGASAQGHAGGPKRGLTIAVN
jgi:hypothetical protein